MSPWDVVLSAMLLTSLAMSAAYFVIWASLGRAPHALTWALSYSVGIVQFGIKLIDTEWATALPSRWPLLNGLGVLAAVLSTIGYRQRAKLSDTSPTAILIWATCLGLAVASGFLSGHTGLRLAAVPLLAALILPVGALAVARSRPLRASEYFVIVVLSAFSLLELGGGLAALIEGRAGDLYLKMLFLGLPAMYATAGVGGALLIASDLAERMRRMAMTDVLTGLFNRRGFEQATDTAVAAGGGKPLSLIVADIDHFKQINDRHGHPGGDLALQRFAALLNMHFPDAVVGRTGGEEFSILCSTDEVEAYKRVDAFRAVVAADTACAFTFTASFGIAQIVGGTNIAAIVNLADRALYASKVSGRNRVTAASTLRSPAMPNGTAAQPAVSIP